jgi:hypothetical protein
VCELGVPEVSDCAGVEVDRVAASSAFLIIGTSRSAIGTVVERTSRFTMLVHRTSAHQANRQQTQRFNSPHQPTYESTLRIEAWKAP